MSRSTALGITQEGTPRAVRVRGCLTDASYSYSDSEEDVEAEVAKAAVAASASTSTLKVASSSEDIRVSALGISTGDLN